MVARERDATEGGGSSGGRRIKDRERESALGAAAVAIVHHMAMSTAHCPFVSTRIWPILKREGFRYGSF